MKRRITRINAHFDFSAAEHLLYYEFYESVTAVDGGWKQAEFDCGNFYLEFFLIFRRKNLVVQKKDCNFALANGKQTPGDADKRVRNNKKSNGALVQFG